ncbi:hypothetical protein SKAU_G00281420 [Synaphobranchus kaupii]|uniref:Uncharacterized protein n=1 Tax=Synaphobranchus kaupii TaxID=118154 RepID=A0A9Q1EX64_SYNKA|nr:hypothetical protein SKAU_G00281420 [Synaphobranchus kaupii]
MMIRLGQWKSVNKDGVPQGRPNHRRRCPANLVCPSLSSHKELSVVGGLWNCWSAVQKADFITAKVRSALSSCATSELTLDHHPPPRG